MTSESTKTKVPTLIIYGATSYTAKELLIYLEDHPDLKAGSFNFILAGRNKDRLDAVNVSLRDKRKVVVCKLDDEDAVKDLVDQGDVVVNLAGPFRWHNGEALIRACALAGKHYVDLCGESAWLSKDIIPKYHSLASSTGSCIVPSCGFDSIPSDLTLYESLRKLQSTYPETTIETSTSLFDVKGTMSGGTVQSMYSIAELPKNERRSGEYDFCPVKKPSTKPSLIYTFPSPSISSFSSASANDDEKKYGSFFFMYPYNRCIIRRSQYLSRHSTTTTINTDSGGDGSREPIHGEDMEYKEGMDVGAGKYKSGLISLGLVFFFGFFFSFAWFRKVVGRFLPKAGEGATSEQLRKGYANVTNIAMSKPLSSGEVVRIKTTYKGQGDPGYLHTTYLLAESALSLVLPPPNGTTLPSLSKKGGLLTPSTAMGQVLVERLRLSGKAIIDSELETIPLEKRKDI